VAVGDRRDLDRALGTGLTLVELRQLAERENGGAHRAAEKAANTPRAKQARIRRHMRKATQLAFRARYFELVADRVEVMGIATDAGLPELSKRACERQAEQEVQAAWGQVLSG